MSPPRPRRPPVSEQSQSCASALGSALGSRGWRPGPAAAHSELPKLSGSRPGHLQKERWWPAQARGGGGAGWTGDFWPGHCPGGLMFMQESGQTERVGLESFLPSSFAAENHFVSLPPPFPPPSPPLSLQPLPRAGTPRLHICAGFLRTFPRLVLQSASVDTAADIQRRSHASTW